MTVILRKKSLQTVITIILMLCMCLPSITVVAKADEKSLAETMNEIAYVGIIKGDNADKGKHLTAHYFVSGNVDFTGKEFGVVIFPRAYLEKYNIYDDYLAQFAAIGKSVMDLKGLSYHTVTGGKIYRMGISNLLSQNLNREFCFVPYLKSGSNIVYGTRHFASYNGLADYAEPTFLCFSEYENSTDGKAINISTFLSGNDVGKSLRTFAVSESYMKAHGLAEDSLKTITPDAMQELPFCTNEITIGMLYTATLKHITDADEKYYFAVYLSADGEDEYVYYKVTAYTGISKNNITANAENGIVPNLGTTTNESLDLIVKQLKKLVNSVWVYVVTAFAAVTVVWGSVIGIKIAIAKRRDEKINARGMIKSLVIGIIVMAVIAVGAPLIITGLSVWAA